MFLRGVIASRGPQGTVKLIIARNYGLVTTLCSGGSASSFENAPWLV